MEEYNFQQELHSLKQRVSDLSIKYLPQNQHMSSPAVNRLHDPFSVQLQDLKAHMASLEDSARGYKRSMQRPLEPLQSYFPAFGYTDPVSSQQNHTARPAPSGPLFWQLFNSLRVDVRTLDSRVASLEQNVSDLEDRVDSFDPNRFTPPASTTTSEVGFTQLPNGPSIINNGSRSHPEFIREFSADMKEAQGCLPIPAEQPVWPMNLERQSVYPNFAPQFQGYQSFYNNYGQPRFQDEAGLRSDIASAGSAINRLHEQNGTMENHISKLDQENGKLFYAVQEITRNLDRMVRFQEPRQVELPAKPTGYSMPESVVFRDREIARMDEQLRIAHERLRASEEVVAQRDNHIEQLRTERDKYDARDQAEKNYQRKEQSIQYRNKLAAKDMEIRDLQDQIEERNDALRRWEKSWNELEESYIHANAKARAYEDGYKESKARKEDEMGQMAAAHRDEMEKIKEFCEQKDAVLQKQEEIISRGGKLLEQRDGEIEGMQRKLRSVEDDREHALRTEQRLSRLLEERDSELSQIKGDSKSARPKRSRSESLEATVTTNVPSRETEGPANNQALPTASKLELPPMAEPHPWIQVGESAAQFHRLPHGERPHGERRAYVWENGALEPVRENGNSADVQPPPNDRKRRARAGGRQRRLPHRYYPELENQQLNSSNAQNRATQDPKTSGAVWPGPVPSEQGRQPLNDITRWPPLPAPVTARRMASEADLHSISHNNPLYSRRNLSKHQSMQDLGKRRLQAYVETDAESGEEVRGEV